MRERPAPAAAPPLPPRFLRHCDEHTVVAVHAVLEAIAAAPQPPRCDRHAVVAAPCQSGRITAARTLLQFRDGGGVTVSPHVVPQCSLHSLAGAVSVALGMHGPHIGVGGGPDALAEGLWTVLTFVHHEAAAAGCNGACAVFSEWDVEPAIDASGAVQDDPARASRPFDRHRDGFVMGEGGAFFLLERRAAALARGAAIRGELAGVGMSSDGSHMVLPCTEPTPAARAISAALADAGLPPDAVDYVNAHAAGTPVGDVAEAAAIRLALGAAADAVPVSSTKSMSGHLISGAAAFEAVACLAAIERQAVPPAVNLDEPDEQCPLDHVPQVARVRAVRFTASNSFGFGGSNLCLVIRKAICRGCRG